MQLRAVTYGPEASAASADAPTVRITVYRSALATWYGPGEYGTETACGQTLRPGTIARDRTPGRFLRSKPAPRLSLRVFTPHQSLLLASFVPNRARWSLR